MKNMLIIKFKMDYIKLILTGLCLIIIQGCSGHTGITLLHSGLNPVRIKDSTKLLPEGVKEFTISPGDVIRVEASGYTAEKKRFLLERENKVQITFHFTKGNYRLMPGDEIRVSFLTDSSLDFDIIVRLDGRISIPKIGELSAAGKTPKKLGQEISKKFRGKINDPRTIISVLRTNMEPINSMEGEYTIRPDGNIHLPMLGTFSAAGVSPETLEKNISFPLQEKFNNNFNASVVTTGFVSQRLEQYDRVITVTPSGGVILPEIGYITVSGLTMNEIKNKIQDALKIRYSNDVDVFLTLISGGSHSVYVGGEVRFPGVYPLAHGMTMLKAVTLSGSATRTGDIGEAVLIHYDKKGDLFIYKTNLEEVMEKGKAVQDLKLSPQDIVFIPRSGIAEANRFIEQYVTGMLPFARSVNYNYNKNPDLNQ